jgi:replication factor C subunit 3/5
MFESIDKESSIPWVEKYRPQRFDDIVLDSLNYKIFSNILNMGYFPNLLLYGPPGTGKTTTIINLINEYQKKYNTQKGCVIHLNASDERGIDIIRNQIFHFVKTNGMFHNELKFVILDEADYMTKNAQQALKYILQLSLKNVRFCLICNYISKIDESLKNEFISIRFNQLPESYIHDFIKTIIDNEKMDIKIDNIHSIQKLFLSDIRSMINFIQLNQYTKEWCTQIITDDIPKKLMDLIKYSNEDDVIEYIHNISIQYNIDKMNIVKNFFNYIIKKCPQLLNSPFLDNMENILHLTASNMNNLILYFIEKMRNFL